MGPFETRFSGARRQTPFGHHFSLSRNKMSNELRNRKWNTSPKLSTFKKNQLSVYQEILTRPWLNNRHRHPNAISGWPESAGDVISSRNVKTCKDYLDLPCDLNFEVASSSSSWDNPRIWVCGRPSVGCQLYPPSAYVAVFFLYSRLCCQRQCWGSDLVAGLVSCGTKSPMSSPAPGCLLSSDC